MLLPFMPQYTAKPMSKTSAKKPRSMAALFSKIMAETIFASIDRLCSCDRSAICTIRSAEPGKISS